MILAAKCLAEINSFRCIWRYMNEIVKMRKCWPVRNATKSSPKSICIASICNWPNIRIDRWFVNCAGHSSTIIWNWTNISRSAFAIFIFRFRCFFAAKKKIKFLFELPKSECITASRESVNIVNRHSIRSAIWTDICVFTPKSKRRSYANTVAMHTIQTKR